MKGFDKGKSVKPMEKGKKNKYTLKKSHFQLSLVPFLCKKYQKKAAMCK